MDNSELNLLSEEVEIWTAEDVVQWSVERFGDGLVLTCSFGGGGLVLAHMLRQWRPDVPILFLDTGFHFPETLQLKQEVTERLNLNVIDVQPALTVEQQAAAFGPQLYARDPDLCCAQRKVAPLAKALLDRQVTGWMSALRRDQSPTRRHLQILESHVVTDHPAGALAGTGTAGNGGPRAELRSRTVAKIHPLATWTRADVARYMEQHDLPRHPLLDAGYTSIGCAPCTRLPSDAQGERSGRWAGTGKTECGLHTFTEPLAPPPT